MEIQKDLRHIPVLAEEVIEFLRVEKGKKYIDTTVGGGGHTKAILQSGGEVLGIDLDSIALKIAQKHLSSACPADVFPWHLAHGNFANLSEIARKHGFFPVSGILFDLGVSSYQLEDEKRGFSFSKEGPLDMRFDSQARGVTAADLVNRLSKKELYEIFFKLAGEKLAWRIAEAIERARRLEPIKTTAKLAELVERVYHQRGWWRSKIHPATKVFLALRMRVNSELENLQEALFQAPALLESKGRLVVISFHSGEDRIVKNFLREKEEEGILKILTKKPIRPTEEEIEKNPKARSAKLRTGEKI